MNDPAAARRFVCLACGWIHLTWAARCSSCLSLKGLALHTGTDGVTLPPPVQPLPDPVETPSQDQEPPVMIRPRLMIARAPSPEPDLADPVEELVDLGAPSVSAPIPLSEIAETSFVRDSTGLPPLDHVLGGGLVVASVVLLASPRGVGKSSLTLQMLDGLGHRCLYVTGEETEVQIAATARRIGAASNKIYVVVERNLGKIFEHARAIRAQTIAIDSIQKMRCEDLDSRAGTPAQVKECTERLVQYAKTTQTTLWLIGHVTGDNKIAGPTTIEHDVDVILELDRGPGLEGRERVLRVTGKNRFGPGEADGRFEMTPKGLIPVDGDGWNEEL